MAFKAVVFLWERVKPSAYSCNIIVRLTAFSFKNVVVILSVEKKFENSQ